MKTNNKRSQIKLSQTKIKPGTKNKSSKVMNKSIRELSQALTEKPKIPNDENPDEINMDTLIDGFENLGFVIDDNRVILRLLDLCRKHNVTDVGTVIRFAKHSLPPKSKIDHTFADSIEDSMMEAIEEIVNEKENERGGNAEPKDSSQEKEAEADKVNL